VEAQMAYNYTVRSVSRQGLESTPTPPVTATAMFVKEPVFTTAVDPEVRGTLFDGETLPVGRHGKVRVVGGTLDLSEGGHVTFPHRGEFELGPSLSVECWVWFDQAGQMPVVVSCGAWQRAGWFLQRLGSRWRWHVGGIDCDGGQPAVGRWIHLLGSYDGKIARLFENGVQVAEVAGAAKTEAWPGDLHVGQYSAGPGAAYQVNGRITGVKIYHRPLFATEVAAAFKAKPR
jgi:large repetitive protein